MEPFECIAKSAARLHAQFTHTLSLCLTFSFAHRKIKKIHFDIYTHCDARTFTHSNLILSNGIEIIVKHIHRNIPCCVRLLFTHTQTFKYTRWHITTRYVCLSLLFTFGTHSSNHTITKCLFYIIVISIYITHIQFILNGDHRLG